MSRMGMQSQFIGGFPGTQAESSIAQKQQQPAETFDEEAFARAFEEAARSEMANVQKSTQQQDIESGQDILINESVEVLMSDRPLNQERIGADTIHDPTSEEARAEQSDPDALSKTAGDLLASVRHDQSAKFQNSQFLELMRQFRDKEATVSGDRVVGVGMIPEEGRDAGGVTEQGEELKVASP